MKQVYCAGVIVFYKDESNVVYYLLLQHSNGNHWSFSKGQIENGESAQEAAIRELYEEAGLYALLLCNTPQAKVHYSFNDNNGEMVEKIVSFFVGQTENNAVTLSSEHTHYVWLPYQQALKKLTYENDMYVLEKINSYIMKVLSQ